MTRMTQQATDHVDAFTNSMTRNPIDNTTEQADTKPSSPEDKALQKTFEHLERQVVNLVSCAIHEEKPLYLGNVRADQFEELDILDDILREYGFMLVWRKRSSSRKQEVPVFLEPLSLPKTANYEGAHVNEIRHGTSEPFVQTPSSTTPETFD